MSASVEAGKNDGDGERMARTYTVVVRGPESAIQFDIEADDVEFGSDGNLHLRGDNRTVGYVPLSDLLLIAEAKRLMGPSEEERTG